MEYRGKQYTVVQGIQRSAWKWTVQLDEGTIKSGTAETRHLAPTGGCCRMRETMESSMSKAGLDNRHRNRDGEISGKHGNTLVRTLRKIYGQSFAAGYPETEKLSEVLLKLNETSLSQLRRDHETGHLEHKIAKASK
jgi:hypothetical protein